jgi:hypothetical protein
MVRRVKLRYEKVRIVVACNKFGNSGNLIAVDLYLPTEELLPS